MTPKDYILLADTLRKVKAILNKASPTARDYYTIALDVFTESLCVVLENESETFDKDKFLHFIEKGK